MTPKKILLTGATSGIGLETAKALAAEGHHLLVHGRDAAKVDGLERTLRAVAGAGPAEGYTADLSSLADVASLAAAVKDEHDALDVLINNAGVLKTRAPRTADGLDVRFVVNTIAPYLLTMRLLPLLPQDGRVINLSSAAQAPVDLDALAGRVPLSDFDAYAQSKLAIAAWTRWVAEAHPDGPAIVSVNPGSLLGTKMVKEGFGMAGKDVGIGVGILKRLALTEDVASVTGDYYDNDARRWGSPHPAALDRRKTQALVAAIADIVGDASLGRRAS
ncbi:MAG: SDR family NAD(P)-dependent oxidoreductase [Polyangiaceae bacterium]